MTRLPTPNPVLDLVRPGDLVVMIGASASGKSTLLTNVPSHQVVSLDRLRAAVSEPGDQGATPDALLIHNQIIATRLRRGKTTYADNTSVLAAHRVRLVRLARQYGRRAVAITVDTPLDTCLHRNAQRPDEQRVPDVVVRLQHRLAAVVRTRLSEEGFAAVHHVRGH
ncbi:AAA family ATPase [Kitasatospora sp. NPDC058184]|uniref:AAA family ATPase n=1 Tax=Kitasatospora sp. NPDC058184 TaxID=3346370 RepID=UPI0036DD6F18